MKFGIVSFPGSNCDDDAVFAATETLRQPAVKLWHKSHDLEDCDVIVLPGGFSYGDYLRAGAIARFSPIMREVAAHAQRGGPVIGICNGFQIACEAGLLPGALMRNAGLQFLSMPVTIRVENCGTRWTSLCQEGQRLTMPIAHGEGRYTVDASTLERVEGEGLVVFRYVDAAGEATDAANVNGSLDNIAGVRNEAGNVVGLMPHPERALDPLLGSADGRVLFESVLATVHA
ncbi:MAG TPA: phosphoribosylformylglycinamidine synthase subunit PurQ [Gemmatimonadaceae bacterium]|jgi:phosphoribosylformylglycinamidine synthase